MTRRTARRIVLIASMALAAVAAAGFALFPHIADDLYSANFIRDAYLEGRLLPDAADYVAALRHILHTNHFRLCNLLMPLIILLPRWIPALISGAALAALYLLAARIGRFADRPLRLGIFAAALAAAYPWPDQLYLTSFQLPYLWGPVAALWMLSLLWRGRGTPAGLALLGWAIGFWHELPAGALLAAALAAAVRYPAMRTARTAAAAAGLAGGVATVALSFIYNSTGGGFVPPAIHSASTFVFLVPAVACLIAAAVCRRRLGMAGFCLAAATAASTVLCVYFCVGPRITAFGTLCALCGLMRLLPARQLMPRRASLAAAAVVIAAVAAHWTAATVMCARLDAENRAIIAAARPGVATIYAPMTLREDVPAALLGKPYYDWWAHSRPRSVMEWMYAPAGGHIYVVPRELRTFSPDSARLIPGSVGMWLWEGHTVSAPVGTTLFTADYGLGPVTRWYCAVPFTAGDGRLYYWVHPDGLSADFYGFHNPRSIDFVQQ